MTGENQELKKEFTVKDFIDDNFKLLSALAIFGALIEFSARLSPAWFGYFLNILFFTCFVIIFIELFKSAWMMKKRTFLLSLFRYILFWLLLLLILYWLAIFKIIEKNIAAMVVFSGLIQLFIWILTVKVKILGLVANKRKYLQTLYKIGIIILMIFISIFLTILITPYLNNLIEQIK